MQVNYTYTRTTNLLGNATGSVTPRVGVSLADYTAGPTLTGSLPDGSTYSVPTFIANQAKVTEGGSGFLLTNWDGYYTDYHGLEVSAVKRLSNRWMGRVGVSLNNAREHYAPAAMYDTNGNPTRTITEPLVDGGQLAPQPQSPGNIYVNARWQFNANGMYQATHGIELAANVFGRQGYPFPLFRTQTLGPDNLQWLVTPQIDTFRYSNVWDTDLRIARAFTFRTVNIRLIGDLFNALNANTTLVRNNNVLSTAFNTIGQNLSPRILRAGLVVVPGTKTYAPRNTKEVVLFSCLCGLLFSWLCQACARRSSQPQACLLIPGTRLRDQFPELLGVVHALQMHELVDQHVVPHRLGHRHEPPVQADVAVR